MGQAATASVGTGTVLQYARQPGCKLEAAVNVMRHKKRTCFRGYITVYYDGHGDVVKYEVNEVF